jgi:hypothetical protein
MERRLERPENLAESPREEEKRDRGHSRNCFVSRSRRGFVTTTHTRSIGTAPSTLDEQPGPGMPLSLTPA